MATKKKATKKEETKKKSTKKPKVEYEIVEEEIIEEEVEEIKPKKKKDKKEEKKPNIIKRALNNPLPIFLVQTIWIIVMIIAYVSLRNSIAMYAGILESEVASSPNIHYFVNNDMNYFHAASVTFTGEDKQIYSYNVGYYVVGDNGELVEFISRSNKLQSPTSLKDVVQDMTGYSFAESTYQRKFFTQEVVRNFNKLHLVISASTEKDSDKADVYYDLPVGITKITK